MVAIVVPSARELLKQPSTGVTFFPSLSSGRASQSNSTDLPPTVVF